MQRLEPISVRSWRASVVAQPRVLPGCRRPASYSAQLVVSYGFFTYLACLRLKLLIEASELGKYTGAVVQN